MDSIENLTGSGLNDNLIGDGGSNVLEGGPGDDRLDGGSGTDTVSYAHSASGVTVNLAFTSAQNTVTAGSDTLSGFENLTGSEFNDTLTGNLGSNVLTGLGGNDRLDGGGGADWLLGGAGSDTYVVDNVNDVVDETDGAGTDTVLAAISFRLCDVGHAIGSIENLTLTGTRAVLGTGNALDNIIVGNSANNILTGLGGNDTLDGSAGADKMFGGTGNDIYVVDNAGDVVDDQTGGGGTDTVKTSITFSLADSVHAMGSIENLILTGTSSINGTGNAIDNVISGNSANNVLAGGLNGGVGDTVSYANAASGANGVGVTVNLSMTSAQNTVTAGSDTLSGFENLTGSEFNDTLTGNLGSNVLTGLGGNDRLDGGGGADWLLGGAGSDTYVVDNVNDVVDETDGAGTDTVLAAISFRLCDVGHAIGSIENLTLTGTRAVLGTGNALDNIIVGNSANNILTGLGGNDTLDGSAGADKMFGGTGNDIYVVDNAGDVVDDQTGGGGTDTVKTSITFSLADSVHAMGSIENLILTGTSSINGTGNAIDNVISGNSANNVLAGGLNGGVGDTVSYANAASGANGVGVTVNLSMTSAQNTVTAGSDTLSGFENLTGSEFNDTLTGDSSNNVLTGLGGNDRLDGGVGNDTLIGNLGADTLTGGSGQDRFVFLSAGEGGDILKDFVVTDDNLVFSASGFGGGLAPRQQLVTGSTFIANAAPTANAAGGSFLYNTVTHDLFWDVDGSGGGEAVQIAHFDTAVVLTAHQFEIVV